MHAKYSTLHIIGGSSLLQERLHKFALKVRQIRVWPPTDIRLFASGNGDSIVKKHSIEGKRIIAYTGTLTKLEGLHVLLETMVILTRQHPDLILLIAGRQPQFDPASKDGILTDFKKMALELELDNYVKFLGLISMQNVIDLLAAADILVNPKIDHYSNAVASPIKIGEYLASGTPLVSTEVCELNQWLTHEKDVLFCEPGNAIDLAEKIEILLSDKELAKQLGENGFKSAYKVCSHIAWAKRVNEILIEL